MITIDTTKETKYSPLIPAVRAICEAKKEETIQIIMNNEEAFKDLKEYLSELKIGFREIYEEDQLTLQFTI
ncbi:sulfurtransferase TusA family protein [Bacteroides sp. OttesenSCG-928-E20]|nr:sulfurtransferase TusA family protein [Bacteroides sp. OttesenSCG-928-N06]MDL2299151.1 sulfurtransferase TusA family protein [Bacteroides sp. OttesenSCG-928-E20]MDL2305803.1 sulfurtransferase TusA family protein [Bacteroides sp. OttesenSCG-928-D19]